MTNGFFGALHGPESIHFIGIGGIGMSGIAEVLMQAGHRVSGSDLQESTQLERLKKLGARIAIGHRPENLGETQAVVYSTAVKASNPEMEEAKRRGITLLHRSEMLAELMRFRTSLAISGTHGKTTTTSMISLLLTRAGLDPTVLIGGRLGAFGSNARYGKGQFLVAEADESDRSFLRLPAAAVVVTNIDTDHMDVYRNLEEIQDAFLQYMNQIPFYGCVVACADDPNLRGILKKVHRRVITYGVDVEADFVGRALRMAAFEVCYDCYQHEKRLGHIKLNVAGRHNAQNSLAAVAVGSWLDLPFGTIAGALEEFRGAERRLEWKGERNGVWVIDDYGHHPTEIKATLQACRQSGRRLVVVYQPHRYSRTQHLMGQMNDCFEQADQVYLLEIYGAGEAPIEGVSSRQLAAEITGSAPVIHVPDGESIVARLEAETRSGDLLLTLGAGDVWKIGEAFLG